MKILLDARLYGLENAGLGRYVMKLVENLSNSDTKNQYVILLRKKYFETLELPENWKKVLADFRHYSFKEQIILPLLILIHKPDLTHFPHFNVPLIYTGKFVVTIHDLLMHTQKGLEATTLKPFFYYIKRLGYMAVFNRAVMGSVKIIVPTSTIKNELVEFYKIDENKVIVTYEGVDLSPNTGNIKKTEGDYFIYTGNAYPHKNLTRLIKSIAFINNELGRPAKLLIASSRNEFTKRLESLIKKLGAGEFVKLLGFVSDADLAALYKNATAFVFPSLSEGFGLPGLEAINAGAVVVCSDIPVFREVYGKNAFYFDPNDTRSIAKELSEVMDLNKSHKEKLNTIAKEFIKKYSWKDMAVKTLEAYQISVK